MSRGSSPDGIGGVVEFGHAGAGDGMTVTVGRIRRCPVHDIRLVALVNNTVRGAAGAVILNAELMLVEGLIGQRSTEARKVS